MWEKLKAKLSETLLKKYAGAIVRHAITWVGGVLAVMSIPAIADLGKLILENVGSIEQVALAILTALIGLLMSFLQKKKDK